MMTVCLVMVTYINLQAVSVKPYDHRCYRSYQECRRDAPRVALKINPPIMLVPRLGYGLRCVVAAPGQT